MSITVPIPSQGEKLPALIPTAGAGATPAVHLPAVIAAAGERAEMRFLEFFATNIGNPHTRRGSS
jgi:hypothetical protein